MNPNVPESTNVWQFCVIFPNCKIGEYCNICANVLIENDVVVGDYCTVKPGVQLWDGMTLEDYVCVGPNVTFTNDLVPRSKNTGFVPSKILIRKGASIGANSTVVAGVEIGEYAFIGAGSVVTKNIPPHTTWYGNPAIQRGYITKDGILLDMDKKDKDGIRYEI
jgi:acetyltransferase-like isoleucine patch superfamily enzyme